jgi:hypothetical protein
MSMAVDAQMALTTSVRADDDDTELAKQTQNPAPRGAEEIWMKTYRGSCHCGKVRFEVDADIDHVRLCDCSICQKRGTLTHRVEESCFRLLTPLDELSVYQWHTRTAKDYFCPACGVLPFRRPRTAPHLWAVNVRCLDDVDLSAITVQPVYGSRLD